MNDYPSGNDEVKHVNEIGKTGMFSDFYNEISSVGGRGESLVRSIGVIVTNHGIGWRLQNYEEYLGKHGIKAEEFLNSLSRPRILILNESIAIMNTEIAHYGIRRFDTEKFEKAWDKAYAALFEEEYC